VPLKPRRLGRVDEGAYTREKVIFDSSLGVSVPAWLLIPGGIKKGERRPGLIAAHGHGAGKDDVCGLAPKGSKPSHMAWARSMRYDYARQAALRGYVVLAPDFAPFGERRPPDAWVREGRDACDIVDLCYQYFGTTLLSMNLWDGMRAVDLLEGLPQADPRRLGVIGLSYGGTLAAHLLANDPRLKLGVVSGYLSTVLGDALGRRGKGNTCGAQALPGLLRHGDIPEILGLAAPKPVLFEIGSAEDCFHKPDMLKAYARVRRFYAAAGKPGLAAKDLFRGRHRWNGEKAWAWLADNFCHPANPGNKAA
jgi:dienelactone hydrolase